MAAKWQYTLYCIKFNTLPCTTGLNFELLLMSVQTKQPAVIEFQTAENVPPTGIDQQIVAVYREQCVDNMYN